MRTSLRWVIGFGISFLVLGGAGCASQKLLIESDPPEGTVYLNDRMIGKTPLTVSYGDLPYEDNLALRIERKDFGTTSAIIQGPRLAGLGEKVRIKLSKSPDETAELNANLDQMMQAHKLALEQRYVEAERLANQLIASHPRIVAPRLLKGAILLMSKNYPLAIGQYQSVLEIDPANEEANKMLQFLSSRAAQGGPESRLPAAAKVESAQSGELK